MAPLIIFYFPIRICWFCAKISRAVTTNKSEETQIIFVSIPFSPKVEDLTEPKGFLSFGLFILKPAFSDSVQEN